MLANQQELRLSVWLYYVPKHSRRYLISIGASSFSGRDDRSDAGFFYRGYQVVFAIIGGQLAIAKWQLYSSPSVGANHFHRDLELADPNLFEEIERFLNMGINGDDQIHSVA